MRSLKYLGVSLAIVLSLGFSGCGAITVDKNLVKSYEKPIRVSSDETLVYVIRESSFVGGGRGLWVGHNKDIITDLGSGDYTYFKVKKGINTINAVQTMTGFSYYAIDETSAEPVFLKFNYAKGTVERLPNDLGISYISKYSEVKTLPDVRHNDGYLNGLLNLAMYKNLNIMTESNATLVPDNKNAVITFIRPDTFADVLKYTIWSDNGIVGNLNAKSYFQVKIPEGKHNFYVKSQVTYALEANVMANKNYVVELDVGMGWTTAHVKLNPIDTNNNNKYLGWIRSSKHLKLNEVLDDNVKERIELALPVIRKIEAKLVSGEKTPMHLTSDFGN